MRPVLLVVACTLLTAYAEYLWKTGSDSFFSPAVILGFVLFGFGAFLMVLALSKGELSVLYPILSLTFVWGLTFSVIFLGEPIYTGKIIGFVTIIVGVVILGRSR